MDTNAKTFSTPDIVIFSIMLIVSISIGMFFAFRNRNNGTLSYFLGNRQLKVLPVAISFVVSFQSSILILGFPAEAYAYGMQYSIQVIGVAISYSMAAWVVVPIFHPLQMTSAYHYYQLRYGENSVRYVAVASGMVYYVLYMGLVIYGTALAMQSVSNIPLWVSIVAFTTVTVLYTSVGGIQAVIWTDVFQCCVMVVGITAGECHEGVAPLVSFLLVAYETHQAGHPILTPMISIVLISSTVKTGGPAKVFELSSNRFNFFNFNPDPTIRHTFWTLLIGSTTQYFYLTISQAGIQRINSTPSMKAAKAMMFISGPAYGFTWVLSMFQGVTLFAYFSKKECDPLASGDIANVNQLVPYSMMELFNEMPGFPGLVISALAAAALSTISSGLSSLAAITYEDIIKQLKPNITDRTATNISKVSVILFGLIAAGISLALMNSQGPLGQLFISLVSSVNGTYVGLYLTSVFFHRARPKAMVLATLIGIGTILWIGSGQNFSTSVPKPSYLPLGPTAHCQRTYSTMNDTAIANATLFEISENVTYYALNTTHASSTEMPDTQTRRTALQTLYSISYMYLSVMGAIIVAVFGIIFSLVTQPKQTQTLDSRLVLSLSDIIPCMSKERTNRNQKTQWITRNNSDDTFEEQETKMMN